MKFLGEEIVDEIRGMRDQNEALLQLRAYLLLDCSNKMMFRHIRASIHPCTV